MSRPIVNRIPGHIVWDGVTIYSESGITVEIAEEVVAVQAGNFGKLGERIVGRMVTVKATPEQFSAAALPKLFPFGSMALGSSIFTLADKPLAIHTNSGLKFNIPCAGVYKEPGMICAIGKPLLGEMEWRGIVGLTADPSLLASFIAKSATAYPGDTTWDPDEKINEAWTASWTDSGGATAWDDIDSVDGITFATQASFSDDKSQRGPFNIVLTDYVVTASCEPTNISIDLLLAALMPTLKFGKRKSAVARDLKLAADGGGAFIQLKGAALKGNSSLYVGVDKKPTGPLTWEAEASFTDGAKNPLLIVSTANPDA